MFQIDNFPDEYDDHFDENENDEYEKEFIGA